MKIEKTLPLDREWTMLFLKKLTSALETLTTNPATLTEMARNFEFRERCGGIAIDLISVAVLLEAELMDDGKEG